MSIWSRILPPAHADRTAATLLFGQRDLRSLLRASLPLTTAVLAALIGLGVLIAAESSAPQAPIGQTATLPAARADPRIDINSATIAELATLPGIGDDRARAIAALREQRPFDSLAALVDRGILNVEQLLPLRDLAAAYVLPD